MFSPNRQEELFLWISASTLIFSRAKCWVVKTKWVWDLPSNALPRLWHKTKCATNKYGLNHPNFFNIHIFWWKLTSFVIYPYIQSDGQCWQIKRYELPKASKNTLYYVISCLDWASGVSPTKLLWRGNYNIFVYIQ